MIGGVATIRGREYALKEMVQSILPQLDKLYVAINDYKTAPTFLLHDKIEVVFPEKDLGDANKFIGIDHCDGYYFSLDDDLIYPGDYVSNMIRMNKGIHTHHGRCMKPDAKRYYRDKSFVHMCLHQETLDRVVDFGGTGVMCINTNKVNLKYRYFDQKNIADIITGIYAKENNHIIIALKHPADWIKHSKKMDMKKTIHATESVRGGIHDTYNNYSTQRSGILS